MADFDMTDPDNYFRCEECSHNPEVPEFVNFGSTQYMVCRNCKKLRIWGCKLSSSWEHETMHDWIESWNYFAKNGYSKNGDGNGFGPMAVISEEKKQELIDGWIKENENRI